MLLQKIADGSFQPGEAEIVALVAQQRPWKIVSERISCGGEKIKFGSARGGEANQLADLVKTFAGGIVEGRANHLVIEFRWDMDQNCMTATDNERHIRLEQAEISNFSSDPGRIEVRLM